MGRPRKYMEHATDISLRDVGTLCQCQKALSSSWEIPADEILDCQHHTLTCPGSVSISSPTHAASTLRRRLWGGGWRSQDGWPGPEQVCSCYVTLEPGFQPAGTQSRLKPTYFSREVDSSANTVGVVLDNYPPYTSLYSNLSRVVIQTCGTDLLAILKISFKYSDFNYCTNHTAQVIALHVPKVKASDTEVVLIRHIPY